MPRICRFLCIMDGGMPTIHWTTSVLWCFVLIFLLIKIPVFRQKKKKKKNLTNKMKIILYCKDQKYNLAYFFLYFLVDKGNTWKWVEWSFVFPCERSSKTVRVNENQKMLFLLLEPSLSRRICNNEKETYILISFKWANKILKVSILFFFPFFLRNYQDCSLNFKHKLNLSSSTSYITY